MPALSPGVRTELERRPLVLALAGLTVGLSAPVFLANPLFGLAGFAFLRGFPARIALAVGFCVGALLAPVMPQTVVGVEPVDGVYTVTSPPTPAPGGGSVFLADGNGYRLEVAAPGLVPVLGDEVSIQGRARAVPQERERTYLSRGVVGVVSGGSTAVTVVRHATGIAAWGSAWRESFVDYSRRRLDPADSAVAVALAFDIRTDLSRSDRTALEQSGTVHVLAASGIHRWRWRGFWSCSLVAYRFHI